MLPLQKNLAIFSQIVGIKTKMGESSRSSGDKNTGAEFGSMFMVHTKVESPQPSVWLLDSGCFSHMT